MPKFQAIQAAHEILGDPIQKAKYDLERAKLNRSRDIESPTFRKPPPPRRTDSTYTNGVYPQPTPQPPPRRDASTSRYAPQNAARSRPQATASSGADKFAQFARAAPSQWDRAKFEEAQARAEGLRGLNAMRPGPVPQTSPLRPRHPTAPRSTGADSYSPGAEPSPGFPGLNRTSSQRRGFGTHAGAGDELPSRSAYAQYHRSERDRPPSAGLFPNVDAHGQQRSRDPVSPLRQAHSFHSDDFTQTRPGLSRASSKYASAGGERTQVNTANIGRSASVRNSPLDPSEEERGPFGTRSAAEQRTPRPRHRSHSPQARNGTATFQYASETSSDEEITPPLAPQDRKKANLRRPATHSGNRDGPGLTGYFPSTNYTRVVDDGSTYDYPAPDTKATPVRKPFTNMTSPIDEHDASANEPSIHAPSQDEVPKHQYEFPFISHSQASPNRTWPMWAVPSSVCPKTRGGGARLSSIDEHRSPSCSMTSPSRWPLRGSIDANISPSSNHSDDNASQERAKFRAEEWHEHFDKHADVFNPPEPTARDRKSPSKNFRSTRAGPGRTFAPTKEGSRDAMNGNMDANIVAGVRHVDPGDTNTKAGAFQTGKLAPDFAQKVNASRRGSKPLAMETPASTPGAPGTETGDTQDDRPTTDEMDVDSPTAPDSESSTGSTVNVTVEEEHSPISTGFDPASRQQTQRHHSDPRPGGFNLNDLKEAGPFVPSNTGLKDLGDLTDNLPYQSRPAENLEALHHTPSSTLRDLNLPRAPKVPHCPADYELNQDSWRLFGDAMTAYMHDWTKFNAAMIEHFRARQEAVTHGMYRNWVCAQGDGATAEDFEASGGNDKAGYATYMTWLEDDKKCRMWWDVAFEEHRVCLEGLGRVRKKIKEMNTRKG